MQLHFMIWLSKYNDINIFSEIILSERTAILSSQLLYVEIKFNES